MLFLLLNCAIVLAGYCPNPLELGPWLGGSCILQNDTKLSTSIGPLTIDFNNTIIECGRLGIQTFQTNYSVLLMQGSLVNCRRTLSGQTGGGLDIVANDSVILRSMRFENCSAHQAGGGIAVTHIRNASLLFIDSCQFIRCTTTNVPDDGQAIYHKGSNWLSLQIEGSSFVKCKNAGGTLISATSSKLSMSSTVFDDLQSNMILNTNTVNLANTTFNNVAATVIVDLREPAMIHCVSFVNCRLALGTLVGNFYGLPATGTILENINIINCSAMGSSTLIGVSGQATLKNWYENTNQTEAQLFEGDINACNRRSSIVLCNETTGSPCTTNITRTSISSSITTTSPSNQRPTSSAPIVSIITTIDKPIIHTNSVSINGLTVHVPSALQGPLITAPLISISGTLVLDLSNFQGDEILLFEGNVEGTFSDLEVIGVSCREVQVQGNTLLIVNTCTTSTANKLAL